MSQKNAVTTNKELSKVWGDPQKTTKVQAGILLRKKLLLGWYRKIYAYMSENLSEYTPHMEIGSGSSLLHEHIKGLIRTNIIVLKDNDISFSAYEMPMKDALIGNLILIDVLHHLRDPYAFFNEAQRVLKPGGRILLCDPYLSVFSYIVWNYLHPENCDRKRLGFNSHGEINPLIDANSANTSILFFSGENPFETKCIDLQVKKKELHTKFHYWLAGGYNFPQLLPSSCASFINSLEKIFAPLDKWLASFAFVVVEKKQ